MRKILCGGWLAQFLFCLIGFHWVAYTAHEFGHLSWPLALLVLLLFCAFGHLFLVSRGWPFPCSGTALATGAWGTDEGNGKRTNSLFFFERNGGMADARYDKVRLLAFGEYARTGHCWISPRCIRSGPACTKSLIA